MNEENTVHPGPLLTKGVPAQERIFSLASPEVIMEFEPEPPASENPFPLSTLPMVMKEMAEAGATASTTPVALTAVLTLSATSIMMGAGVELDCGGTKRCCANLHILGIMESGTGKSEAVKAIFQPINSLQRTLMENWEKEVRPQLRAQIAMLKRRESDKKHPPSLDELTEVIREREAAEFAASDKARPLIYAANATRESLAGALACGPNQAFAVVNADARGQLGVIAGKYSGGKATDEDIYLAGYSRDAMSSLRVGSGLTNVEKPCLSMCLLIQPDVFADMQSNGIFAESGWLQRCLLLDSKAGFPPLPISPPPIPAVIYENWEAHLNSRNSHFRSQEKTLTVVPSKEAREFMLLKTNEVREKMNSGEYRDIASFASRYVEQANRIALILHCTHYSTAEEAASEPLELITLRDAWEIVEWFISEQIRLLSPMRLDRSYKRAEELVMLIRRHGKSGQMPRWKLRVRGYTETELNQLATAYPNLLQVGETSSGPKGGRTSKWIRALN